MTFLGPVTEFISLQTFSGKLYEIKINAETSIGDLKDTLLRNYSSFREIERRNVDFLLGRQLLEDSLILSTTKISGDTILQIVKKIPPEVEITFSTHLEMKEIDVISLFALYDVVSCIQTVKQISPNLFHIELISDADVETCLQQFRNRKFFRFADISFSCRRVYPENLVHARKANGFSIRH